MAKKETNNLPNAAARNLDAFVVRTAPSVPFRAIQYAPLRFDAPLLLPPPKLFVLLLLIDVESADDVMEILRVGDVAAVTVTPCQHGIVLPLAFVFIDRAANG